MTINCSTVSLRFLFGGDSLALDFVLGGLSSLDCISLLLEIACCALVECQVAIVHALLTQSHASRDIRLAAISCLVGVCSTRDRSNSDVLVEELGGREISEYLPVIDSIIGTFISLTLLQAIKLADNDCVHGLEHGDEVDWVLLEELVLGQGAELLIASSRPVGDLVVNDVDLLETLLEGLIVTIYNSEILVHLNDLSIVRLGVSLSGIISVIGGIDLELLEPLGQLLVILLKRVNLGFTGGDRLQESGVGLLTLLEATDHGLNVCDASVCLDLLEGIVDASGGFHLLVHLSLHEVVPQLVDVEIVSHLELGGVFALVSSSLSDLLILLLALNTALNRLFLIGDASLEFEDSLLTITLLLLDVLHQVVEDVFRLELILLGLASLAFLNV